MKRLLVLITIVLGFLSSCVTARVQTTQPICIHTPESTLFFTGYIELQTEEGVGFQLINHLGRGVFVTLAPGFKTENGWKRFVLVFNGKRDPRAVVVDNVGDFAIIRSSFEFASAPEVRFAREVRVGEQLTGVQMRVGQGDRYAIKIVPLFVPAVVIAVNEGGGNFG